MNRIGALFGDIADVVDIASAIRVVKPDEIYFHFVIFISSLL